MGVEINYPYVIVAATQGPAGPRGPQGPSGGGGSDGSSGFTSIALSGTTDGTNKVFTLNQAPVSQDGLMIFKGGIFQTYEVDYTLSGQTLTYTSAPASGIGHIAMGATSSSTVGETPSGTVDGLNDTFTLSSIPANAGSLLLFMGGVYQSKDIDYTISVSTITFSTPPKDGLTLYAIYS
jgi:hypothetical protein